MKMPEHAHEDAPPVLLPRRSDRKRYVFVRDGRVVVLVVFDR